MLSATSPYTMTSAQPLRLARKLVAQLEAPIADGRAFGECHLERRLAAERRQIVVAPRDRIDADAHLQIPVCRGRRHALYLGHRAPTPGASFAHSAATLLPKGAQSAAWDGFAPLTAAVPSVPAHSVRALRAPWRAATLRVPRRPTTSRLPP